AHRGSVPYRNAALVQRFGRANEMAARDAFRNDLDTGHDDLFRDRADLQHFDEPRDRADAERPDAFHRAEDAAARRIAPAIPQRREADIRRDAGERFERGDAFPRHDFSRPRIGEGADIMRWRSLGSARPAARAFGGFHPHIGFRRL